MTTTVFLGGGNIAASMIAGLRRASSKQRLVVHDRNPQKLRTLKRRFGVAVEPSLARAVAQADLLIIAVRPADVADLSREIRGLPRKALVLEGCPKAARISSVVACSVAAGIPLHRLRAALPALHWARAMPSPACHSGYGLTALCFDSRARKRDRALVRHLFRTLGTVIDIPERQFDAFTATYSCSHGYHALAVLAGAGHKVGLDRKTALLAAAHALADGILVWRKGRLSLEDLLEEAATPGGIAASVISSMNQQGYSTMVEEALLAGIARAHQNRKSVQK